MAAFPTGYRAAWLKSTTLLLFHRYTLHRPNHELTGRRTNLRPFYGLLFHPGSRRKKYNLGRRDSGNSCCLLTSAYLLKNASRATAIPLGSISGYARISNKRSPIFTRIRGSRTTMRFQNRISGKRSRRSGCPGSGAKYSENKYSCASFLAMYVRTKWGMRYGVRVST